jgi:molecular chaperone HscB
MARDHFEVFGLSRAYHLDQKELESRYLTLQKETHPDRFVKALPRERAEAVARNTELNDAYKVLKNDIKRAEYILFLEGISVGDEKAQSVTATTRQINIDPKFLIEVMELREALTEARAEGNEDLIQSLTEDVLARGAAAKKVISEGFAAYEDGDRRKLDAIAKALISLRYYGRFMDAVEDGKNG